MNKFVCMCFDLSIYLYTYMCKNIYLFELDIKFMNLEINL